MKRLIFILAVVCTVFIGFGSVGYAYSKGDVVCGVTLAQDYSEYSEFFVFSEVTDRIFLTTTNDIYIDNYVCSHDTNAKIVAVSRSTGSTNTYYYFGSLGAGLTISDCSCDILDKDGNVVFQQTPPAEVPEVTVPVPEGIAAVQIIPQAITSNLAVLIPLGLVVLAILLGMRLLPRLVALFLR